MYNLFEIMMNSIYLFLNRIVLLNYLNHQKKLFYLTFKFTCLVELRKIWHLI